LTLVERRSLKAEQGFLPTIVSNDDLSLASAFPELGLHIGQDEPDLAAAR